MFSRNDINYLLTVVILLACSINFFCIGNQEEDIVQGCLISALSEIMSQKLHQKK